MAKYRPIYTKTWKDPDFENFNPNMKLIFLYLCTNELTTESGIYAISIKTISNETGIDVSVVEKLLKNGFKNVKYDFTNNCVFIKNFLKYNGGGNPELVKKSIMKNCEEFNTPLWDEFIKQYPEYYNCLQTVYKQLGNSTLDIDIEYRNSISNIRGDYKGGEDENEINTDIDMQKQKEKGNEVKEIIAYLNEKAGTNYKPTTKKTISLIKARFNEGFTLTDFKTVIDKKINSWAGTEWEKFIRPETLFGTKFESYLNEKIIKKGDINANNRGSTKRFANEREYTDEEQRRIEEKFYA